MRSKPAHLVEQAAGRLSYLDLLNEPAAPSSRAGHPDAPYPADAVATAAVGASAPHSADGVSQDTGLHSWAPPRPIINTTMLRRAGMLDRWRGRHRILEEFRLMQRQLLRAASADPEKTAVANLVMVTSARPGEGKSFVSLNLACSIALQGDHDVLLVDCDPTRSSICRSLELEGAPGILDLAANPRLVADDVILRTDIENMFVLPIGSERERSSELFAGRDMAHLLQRLGRRGGKSVVILDAASCLSTSDPAALSSAVGQILIVVQAERTQREEVEATLELLHACPSIMLLLNKAHPCNRHAFGTYSSAYQA